MVGLNMLCKKTLFISLSIEKMKVIRCYKNVLAAKIYSDLNGNCWNYLGYQRPHKKKSKKHILDLIKNILATMYQFKVEFMRIR